MGDNIVTVLVVAILATCLWQTPKVWRRLTSHREWCRFLHTVPLAVYVDDKQTCCYADMLEAVLRCLLEWGLETEPPLSGTLCQGIARGGPWEAGAAGSGRMLIIVRTRVVAATSEERLLPAALFAGSGSVFGERETVRLRLEGMAYRPDGRLLACAAADQTCTDKPDWSRLARQMLDQLGETAVGNLINQQPDRTIEEARTNHVVAPV